jgi:glycosyltransferase involved in cell wall biosynthesis
LKKTKVVLISDDSRLFSGVAVQSKKLLKGLLRTGRYEVVQIAGSQIQQNPAAVDFEGIKLYPSSEGYGNPNLVRQVMAVEKPDVMIAFSDPRFFSYLFMMDNELRPKTRLIFYHTWDNGPFPKFNNPWYAACDRIVMLSKFSHKLIKEGGVECDCIPHGMDPSEFFPLDSQRVQNERAAIMAQAKTTGLNVSFIIFYNNRNIWRKRPGDVMNIFRQFSKTHPDVLLLMHTAPIDKDGTDLVGILNDVNVTNSPVVFSINPLPADKLNILYNIADVTINIAYNEGFGLCVAESLCAGTPVIATRTGGMPEQIETEEGPAGILLDAPVRELFGVPGAPYIYRDYVTYDQTLAALEKAYQQAKTSAWKKEVGQRGRDHIVQNYHIDETVHKWDMLIQDTLSKPSVYKPWRLTTL